MNQVIYKYKLGFGVTNLELPYESKILCAMSQGENVCIWAQHTNDVNESSILKKVYTFFVIPTGSDFTSEGKIYLNSVKMLNDKIILHIYLKDDKN